MKKFNIVTKKTYKDRNGQDKAQWNSVGSLVYFPATQDKREGYKLELNMHPNTAFYIFEQKPKEERRGVSSGYMKGGEAGSEPMLDDINPGEIPF